MTTQHFSIKVSQNEHGKRLDIVAGEYAPGYSRAHLQRLIENGSITVNGKAVKKHYKVKNGDVVVLDIDAPETPNIAPDASVPFRVVFENDEYAVVEKPAGVVTHPSASHKKGTLVNGLVARWPEIAGVGEDPLRPGIVHRLDKDTSGLLVVAKTQPMFLWLKKQFHDRTVEKRYVALVAGSVGSAEGEIDVPIARSRSRKNPRQIAVSQANTRGAGKAHISRKASTGFKILHLYKNFTLIEAMPKTGRMHQIRVHFAHIGHPLAGDVKYAPKRVLSALPLERHFLHAAVLAFPLPDGAKASFSSELPSDLKRVLERL